MDYARGEKCCKDGSPKKTKQPKRQKKRDDNLVYGAGVTMEKSKSYLESVIMGRVCGRISGLEFLKEWSKELWRSKFLDLPIIYLFKKN